jgi:hypothetical protein
VTSSRQKDQTVYLVIAAVLMSGAFLMFYFALNSKAQPQVQGASTSQPESVVKKVKKAVSEPGRLSPQQLQEDASGVYW